MLGPPPLRQSMAGCEGRERKCEPEGVARSRGLTFLIWRRTSRRSSKKGGDFQWSYCEREANCQSSDPLRPARANGTEAEAPGSEECEFDSRRVTFVCRTKYELLLRAPESVILSSGPANKDVREQKA